MRGAHRPWSCDTFAVEAAHTTWGATMLGKNSDRPARETQPLRHLGARRGGGPLQLAYLEVDDAPETLPHLGSSPYWCWGHETGLNAAGVAIGNEALFTRDGAAAAAVDRAGAPVTPGILGMELVRLGLERAGTAADAVEVMTALVERYGQYGAGTAGRPRPDAAYDNSYLIADAGQVWALETTGRRWAAKAVDTPFWALSNEATIRSSYDRNAPDLEEHARTQGWHQGPGPVDFAAAFSDPHVPLQVSHIRLQRSRQMLGDALKAGPVGFADAARVLADHYEDTFLDGPKFNPARPDFHTLCMHEHPAGFTWGNTASSVIAVLPATARPYMWWAATTPCTSVYLPVAVTDRLPAVLSVAGTVRGAGPSPERVRPDRYRDGSYWWAFQELLEAVAADGGGRYHARQPRVRGLFDELQRSWLSEVEQAVDADDAHWRQLTARCTAQAMQAATELVGQFTAED